MVVFTRRRALQASLAALPRFASAKASQEVVVGAAANLTSVFQVIGPAFERETGIHPVFSYASTAQIAQQIEERAPIDLFAAADTEHSQELERKGLLAAGSRAVYATGILALWIPPSARAAVHGIGDLAKPEVRIVAAAKPELAPYGLAAVEALQHSGLWEVVKPKMVYASNVSMVQQYGSTGNADAVFTAMSLVRNEPGKVLEVDPKLHHRLDQELGITSYAANKVSAVRFRQFLLTGNGRDILAKSGYRLPR